MAFFVYLNPKYEMANGKNSFVLYCDMIHTISLLEDELAGKLFKHLLKYVNDESPETDDILLKVAFEPIKRQLKRDLKDWEITKEDRSNSGKLGNLNRWNKDLYDKVIDEQITLIEAENIAKSRKASHSDKSVAKSRKASHSDKSVANIAVNDSGTVNVNDTVILSDKNEKNGKSTTKQFVNPKTQGQDLYAGKFREYADKENNTGTKDN